MKTVVIENIGAVQRLEIPIPEGGGLVRLRGRNGAGKSTALRAVEGLLGGDSNLEKRDGAPGGEVSGFGARLSVKKSTRRSGVLEVESLDSRLSAAELVNPNIADAAKADAKRIKALVQLAGVAPDVAMFADIIPAGVSIEAGEAADAVSLSSHVKRQLERLARDAESLADKAAGSATALKKSSEVVKGKEERVEPAKLQAGLHDAIREEARLKSDAANGKKILKSAEAARESLERLQSGYQGMVVDEAKSLVRTANKNWFEAKENVERAEKLLAEATRQRDVADAKLSEAQQHESNFKAWSDSIAAAADVKTPSDSDIAAATTKVATLQDRIRNAEAYRRALGEFSKAKTFQVEADKHAAQAEALRSAARRTDEVLSEIVGRLKCPLRVADGRLVLDTDRGQELYADLSDGERWRVALDVVVPFLPADGILTIPQAAFGELDPTNRAYLDQLCRERHVVILTAEATDDEELSAEPYSNGVSHQ